MNETGVAQKQYNNSRFSCVKEYHVCRLVSCTTTYLHYFVLPGYMMFYPADRATVPQEHSQYLVK